MGAVELLRARSQPQLMPWLRRYRDLVALAVLAVFFILMRQQPATMAGFPAAWNLHLRQPIDRFDAWVIGHQNTHWLWVYGLDPVSHFVDGLLRGIEAWLLWLPWVVVLLAVVLVAHRLLGWRGALGAGAGMLLLGLLGLWTQSMQTLSLMVVAVLLSLLIGIPLGLLAGRKDRVDTALRPLLDAMQTLPAFVYLIPVLLFFGIARVPAVVATVIFALPPVIRLTSLGIRHVPDAALETARSFGSTSRQMLVKVEIPLALPTIMAGVNQTIMMALGMVVIAALIGAGGLGREVLTGLQRLRVGQAFEAGLAIVILAVLLDRLSFALVRSSRSEQWRWQAPRTSRWQVLADRFPTWLYVALGLALVLAAYGIQAGAPHLSQFPEQWHLPLDKPVDASVRWARDHLYSIGGTGFGTGALSDGLTLYAIAPLRAFLQDWTPWPVIVLGMAILAARASGWRLAFWTALGMFAIGLLGMWNLSMDTFGQVIVAVVLALLIAIPLGIACARSDRFAALLRPVLDFLQTIPPFVYLIPVVMLFNVGRVPGIIASVLYALPPAIRLTNLGIRQVDPETVEAARAFGSTRFQVLLKVELPLAMPSIMMGVNQTVMMVLSMVIIGGLVGGAGLGLESVIGLAKSETGRGIEAGLAIVILAMVFDRITQGWAQRWRIVENP